MRPKLSYANVMATIAVFIALGGASYAAIQLPKSSVGSKQLKKNAVTSAKIRKGAVSGAKVKDGSLTGADVQGGSLTGTQINASTLGTVPTADTANALIAPENWHEVGAAGEPGFQNSWANAGGGFSTAAFYKDSTGIVHLKGNLSNAADDTVAFTLPVGYRPSQGLFMPAAGAPAPVAANLVIQSDGDAIPTCAGAGSCIAGIDGLTFRVP